MTAKETLKTEILLKMQHHLGTVEISILENVLNDSLYGMEITKECELPAINDDSNEYILQLYEFKRSQRLTEKTMVAYMDTAKDFLRFIAKPLPKITKEDVEHYLSYKRKNCCNSTINDKRRNLNSLFKWMQQYGFISQNPMLNIEHLPETVKPIDYMTPIEMELLKTGCRRLKDRALIEYLRCTASRIGELPNVRINQIDWRTGKITIYGHKTDAYRSVFIDEIAIKYITDYLQKERGVGLNSNEYLFTHSNGDKTIPMTDHGLYGQVKRIAKRSEIPDNRSIYPHLFRKTTATNIVKRGGTIDDAGCYLGHKPEGVTARHYASLGEKHTEKVFEMYVETI